MRITEVKRHLDGREERFACDLVLRRPHVAVLRHVSERARYASGFRIPAGSRTLGFFWPRRPYVLYRIEAPSGALIVHRFDVVEDVRIAGGEVSYRDLLLDVCVDPAGRAAVDDEDEVADSARRGALSRAQAERIDATRALLLRRHGAIVREAVRLIRGVDA